jgi:RNA polymerase sigma-70 factor, ECF subfamily
VDAGARLELFETAVLPHLRAAYNLARWLTRDPHDAEDLVQDCMVRAFTYFDGFHGQDGRAWLLAIVRNAFYTMVRRRRGRESVPFEEELHVEDGPADPETLLLQRVDAEGLGRAIGELPAAFREVLVLREIEGLSYRQIADVAGIPIGTVMSRLARARGLVKRKLAGDGKGAAT